MIVFKYQAECEAHRKRLKFGSFKREILVLVMLEIKNSSYWPGPCSPPDRDTNGANENKITPYITIGMQNVVIISESDYSDNDG